MTMGYEWLSMIDLSRMIIRLQDELIKKNEPQKQELIFLSKALLLPQRLHLLFLLLPLHPEL